MNLAQPTSQRAASYLLSAFSFQLSAFGSWLLSLQADVAKALLSLRDNDDNIRMITPNSELNCA
jgi:hypothetical protein